MLIDGLCSHISNVSAVSFFSFNKGATAVLKDYAIISALCFIKNVIAITLLLIQVLYKKSK